MPDYSLPELREFVVVLDTLTRMGDAAEDAGFNIIATVQPGQMPILRLDGLRVPLSVPGVFDPVQDVVPPRSAAEIVAQIEAAIGLVHGTDSYTQTSAGASSSLSATDGLPDDARIGQAPEITADATASLVQGGDDLPGNTPAGQVDPMLAAAPVRRPPTATNMWTAEEEARMVELIVECCLRGLTVMSAAKEVAPILGRAETAVVGRASRCRAQVDARLAELRAQGAKIEIQPKPRPDAWSAEEDDTLVEGVARRMLAGQSRHQAATQVADLVGRPVQGVVYRAKGKMLHRIDARLAEMRAAQEDAAEGGTSAIAEQAGVAEQSPLSEPEWGQAVPAAPAEQDAADGGASAVAEQAGVEAAVSAAPAPAAEPPLPSAVPYDALTDHLMRPMTRRSRSLADDLQLIEMCQAKIPTGIIASELGLQPAEVMACFDRLTGYDRQTKARRYGAKEIEARLRILVAHYPATDRAA